VSWVDLIIVGIVIISALISLVRGFVKESISLASWVLAGFIALRYFAPLAELLEPYVESPTIRTGTSFAILFVCSLIIGAIVNFMASQLVTKTGLSGTDKSLGVVFGAARGLLIVVILVLLAGLTPMPSESWWQASTMIDYFSSMANWIKDIMPDDLASNFSI
jgi:membrane protein required for colicin V production